MNFLLHFLTAYAAKKFDCGVSEIRQHMTTKINNDVKCSKAQKVKAEF